MSGRDDRPPESIGPSWDEAFARSQGQLSRLAEKVRAGVAAGCIRDFGVDEL
jgi:hypothetical protein